MSKHAVVPVLLLVFSFVFVSVPAIRPVKAEAETVVVPDDYATINYAIGNASFGDTIYVKSGEYHENLVISKRVSLVGEDMNTTIIDGNPDVDRTPIVIKCDSVTVSGFTIKYGYAAIQFWGAVENCTISGNRITEARYGIRGGTRNNITGNIFESIGIGSAIRLEGSEHNFVHQNYIDSCNEGIQLMWGGNYNTVTENTIVNCVNQGIRLQNSDGNTVKNNTVKNNGFGVTIYIANNNFVQNNNFVDNTKNVGADESYALAWGYGYSLNSWKRNFYSDYNGTDTDGDGIGDTPYNINEANRDNSPLIEPEDNPVLIPEFPTWTPLLIMLVAVAVVATIYRRVFPSQGMEETE